MVTGPTTFQMPLCGHRAPDFTYSGDSIFYRLWFEAGFQLSRSRGLSLGGSPGSSNEDVTDSAVVSLKMCMSDLSASRQEVSNVRPMAATKKKCSDFIFGIVKLLNIPAGF